MILEVLNLFFFVFHIVLILFNVFGWIFKRMRKLHLISVGLTAFSWLVLGFFYGFGYCFLTDWHWDIRGKLGYSNESNSYIHFLVTRIPGVHIGEETVDIATGIVFFTVLIIAIWINVRRPHKSD